MRRYRAGRVRAAEPAVDADSGRELATLEAPEPKNASALGFSPDGRLLVVGMLGRVVYVLEGEDAVVYADLRHLARFPVPAAVS